VANGEFVSKPHRIQSGSRELRSAIDRLAKKIEARFPGLTNARWVALRLLEGDARLIEAVRTGELRELTQSEKTESVSALGAT
jgi:ferrous iron transport protein B